MKALKKNPQSDTDIYVNEYIDEFVSCLSQLDKTKVARVIERLMQTYVDNKQVFIIGNGGSASTASHMACDLGKGTLKKMYDNREKRFRVISLTDNVALLTAFANDLSYEHIFVQQLRNLINPGDVVIALSASGSSKNILKALKYASACKAYTIGFFGFRYGGQAAKIVNLSIIVNSNNYGICEDTHLILNHIITYALAKIKHAHDRYPKYK